MPRRKETKPGRIDYVKPAILDLGEVTTVFGGGCDATGNEYTADPVDACGWTGDTPNDSCTAYGGNTAYCLEGGSVYGPT